MAKTSIRATLGGKKIYSARTAMREAQRLGTPTNFWGLANSYTCPRGKRPGVAYVLMRRGELDDLALELDGAVDAAPQELKLVENQSEGSNVVLRTVSIAKLWLYRAECINHGTASDANRLYLCEWRDVRQFLQWSHTNQSYNVRQPIRHTFDADGTAIYEPSFYYADTLTRSLSGGGGLTPGLVWTWQQMLDNLWVKLPQSYSAGAAPTLPYTPLAVPESWSFVGVTAWDAIHQVLATLSCTTAYNPIAHTFSYVRIGATQSEVETEHELLKSAGRLIYDYDPIESRAANMAARVRPRFERTGRECQLSPYDAITGDLDTSVQNSDTTVGWRGGYDVYYDDDQVSHYTAISVNGPGARRTQIENAYSSARQGWKRMRRIYSGLTTAILPGARVSEVCWRDYGDGSGLVTDVRRHYDPLDSGDTCDCRPHPRKAMFIEFEVTTDFTVTDSTFSANILDTSTADDGARGYFQGSDPDPDDEEIVIWNPRHTILKDCGPFNGELSGDRVFWGHVGNRGIAVWDDEHDAYIAIAVRPHAKKVEFQLDGPLTEDDASIEVTVLDWWDGSPDPDIDCGGFVVWNLAKAGGSPQKYFYTGVEDDHGYAEYDERNNKWRIYAIGHCCSETTTTTTSTTTTSSTTSTSTTTQTTTTTTTTTTSTTTTSTTTTTLPTGACCTGNFGCEVTDESYCVNVLFGSWQGEGTFCDPNPCGF